MKGAIWKFPLEVTDDASVMMPIGAKILTVQVQNGTPCLWAHVNPKANQRLRRLRIHWTGHECIADGYIGSFQFMHGSLVFHVFDDGEANA